MPKLIVLFFALVLPFGLVFGLDENAAKEKECNVATPSVEQVGLDLNWMKLAGVFYTPLWSKLHYQRTLSDLLEKEVSEIKEDDVKGRPTCFQKQGRLYSGFARAALFNITGDDETSFSFKGPWEKSKSGKFSYHLTDNRNFILGVTCWEDNQSSWSVLSTTPFLEPSIRRRIIKYVSSLGFKEDLAVDETYYGCPVGGLILYTRALAVPVYTRPVVHSYATLPLVYYKKK